MKREIFFDVETKKLFDEIERDDPGLLGVSIVSVYSRTIDETLIEQGIIAETDAEMQSFWEADFDKMWPMFSGADRIIGFNTIGFDVPTLLPYTDLPLSKFNHFDIMAKFKEVAGHRISLDALSKETLDREKIDSGLNAVFYWKKGDRESLQKLQMYCEEDVRITKDVYDYALKNKKLLYKDKWNTLREISVDFSYPKAAPEVQIGLF